MLKSCLKCEKCGEILVHLGDFDLEQNFEQLNAMFKDTLKNFTTQENNIAGGGIK